jgi:hypothetical protein
MPSYSPCSSFLAVLALQTAACGGRVVSDAETSASASPETGADSGTTTSEADGGASCSWPASLDYTDARAAAGACTAGPQAYVCDKTSNGGTTFDIMCAGSPTCPVDDSCVPQCNPGEYGVSCWLASSVPGATACRTVYSLGEGIMLACCACD